MDVEHIRIFEDMNVDDTPQDIPQWISPTKMVASLMDWEEHCTTSSTTMDDFDEPMDVDMVPVTNDTDDIDCNQTSAKTFNTEDVQMPEVQTGNRYENHGGTASIDEDEEISGVEGRAERSASVNELRNSCDPEQYLYASMGIAGDIETVKNSRLNVLHMRGTQEMSTEDVFKYFDGYGPASIEWINDISCNVVWLDNESAAKAMLKLSKKIEGLEKQRTTRDNPDRENDITNEDPVVEMVDDDETTKDATSINIKDIDCPLPPGLWRKGVDTPKSKAIFLRFATRADKKQPNAEKMSSYYKKHGNPNFGGAKGLLSRSRKRLLKKIKQSKRRFKEEPEDGVEDRKVKKNPWGALSKSWGLNDAMENEFTRTESTRSVKQRLGVRQPQREVLQQDEEHSSASNSGEDDDWKKRNKGLRMRMHADDEEERIYKRRAKLRQERILNKLKQTNDLRSRLGRPKKETQFHDAIQVVVTNQNIIKSDSFKLPDSEEEDGEIVENEDQEKEESKWQRSDEEGEDEQEEDEEYSDADSDKPVKEVQGPKGSVIKVVRQKPRVASTVWARLNNAKNEVNDNFVRTRQLQIRDLRTTLKGGDLRSRIGRHTRGRSPLRIEVRNDKFVEGSDTE